MEFLRCPRCRCRAHRPACPGCRSSLRRCRWRDSTRKKGRGIGGLMEVHIREWDRRVERRSQLSGRMVTKAQNGISSVSPVPLSGASAGMSWLPVIAAAVPLARSKNWTRPPGTSRISVEIHLDVTDDGAVDQAVDARRGDPFGHGPLVGPAPVVMVENPSRDTENGQSGQGRQPRPFVHYAHNGKDAGCGFRFDRCGTGCDVGHDDDSINLHWPWLLPDNGCRTRRPPDWRLRWQQDRH